MSDLGVIPAPASSEDYVELGDSPSGTLFKKHILNLGPLIHPVTGKVLELGEQFWQQLKTNFDSKAATDIVQVPVVGADNKHTEAPDRNIGRVVGLERDGSKIYAVLDVRDPDAAGKLGKTMLGASAFLNMNATDNRTGEKVGAALFHCAVTNRPYVALRS